MIGVVGDLKFSPSEYLYFERESPLIFSPYLRYRIQDSPSPKLIRVCYHFVMSPGGAGSSFSARSHISFSILRIIGGIITSSEQGIFMVDVNMNSSKCETLHDNRRWTLHPSTSRKFKHTPKTV